MALGVTDVTFAVRHGDDRYPVGGLVVRRAAALGLSRTEFVQRLGYRNVDKGHRKLNHLSATGVVPVNIRNALAASLEVEPSVIEAAIAETAAQHSAEKQARLHAEDAAYRAAFHPHLRVEVEHPTPTPFFVAIIYGPGLRIVPLPEETWTSDEVARRRLIKRAIVGHYNMWRGRLPCYGRIAGYVAVTEMVGRFDAGMPYGVDGDPVGLPVIVERISIGALTVKGHPLRPSLFHGLADDVGKGKRCGTIEWPPSD